MTLRLAPWHPAHILALIERPEIFPETAGFEAAPGLRELFVSDDVSPDWLAALRDAAGPDPWRHGFAVIDVATGHAVGSAGFVGPPDADGTVEIAYGIAPAYGGKGYATGAARGLIEHAMKDPAVRLLCAHTLPHVNASTRILAKCGFTKVGEVVHPHDGTVWRWERPATTLYASRTIAAAPARVWAAIADPEALARWWGPNGFTNVFESFDFRPGGSWVFTMTSATGGEYANRSEFGEIVPGERVVIRHVSKPHFTLTITLAERGGGTDVGWRQVFPSPEDCRKIAGFVGDANEQNLDRLAAVVLSSQP